MMLGKEKPAGATAGGESLSNTYESKDTTRRRPSKFWSKRRRILRLLLIRPQGLHTLEARHHGETCLHSTVAAWEGDGIEIAREYVQRPGWGGEMTRVARYFLTPEQREVALDRLARDAVAAGLATSREEAVRFVTQGDREVA